MLHRTFHQPLSPYQAMLGALLLFTTILFPNASARAHDDPGGCNSNGVGLSFTVLRADGITPVGAGTVQSGETINYQATLSHLGVPNCNFEGGQLDIMTPDGIAHSVASGAGIPLVSFGVPFTAPLQVYVVSEADVTGGNLHAIADYASGISHTGDSHDTAGANVDKNTPYQDMALEVTKTATPAREITYQWTIDKSVMPPVWNLFTGDSGTSAYTITLTKSVASTSYAVSGTITIHNPAGFADATISAVSDAISGVGAVVVVCPGGLPQVLGPGATLVCTYTSPLPDDVMRTNTATVTASGDVAGGSDDETIDFTGIISDEVNGTVMVDDMNDAGDAGPFSDSTMYAYARTFMCDGDEGVHENTAMIIETGQSDDASVTVNCFNLSVVKSALTTFDRQYHWMVDKNADATDITLASGQTYDITYTVEASVSGVTDSNWAVTGTITVHNPAPIPATINSVSDIVGGAGAAVVNCGPAVFPYTLGPGADLVCTYSKALLDGTTRTNTATAVHQHYDYDSQMVPTPAGTTETTGNAAVTFGAPANVLDEEVTVTDSYAGLLGAATAAESPKSFTYMRTVSFTEDECGAHTIDNTATITTNDTGVQDSDALTVHIQVNCPLGCTQSDGYWKSKPGSWPVNSLMLGSNTYAKTELLFILRWPSGKYDLTSLARHLITAKLNILNGASDADIAATIAAADALIGNKKLPSLWFGIPPASQIKPLVQALNNYNKGITGPGNCKCLCLKDGGTLSTSCTP